MSKNPTITLNSSCLGWWLRAGVLFDFLVSLLKVQSWGVIPERERNTPCILKWDGITFLPSFSLFGLVGWNSELPGNGPDCLGRITIGFHLWLHVKHLQIIKMQKGAQRVGAAFGIWFKCTFLWAIYLCLHTFLLWRPTSCHKAAYQIGVFRKQCASNPPNSGNRLDF